ncbi:PepSY-associated TM helix domain-containing protein [Mycolicibacterium phlei]
MATSVTSATPDTSDTLSRRIWRTHFWVALFTAPALIVLACSGLVILYSQPLDTWLNRDLLTVERQGTPVPLDEQVATAREHVGADHILDAVIPPPEPGRSTRVDFVAPDAAGYPAAEGDVTQVFVDPYTGRYLGQRSELSGLIGWANQVHRLFGNDGPQVRLPSLGHLIDPSAYPEATIPVGIGNLWMEITAVWILVLLATGVYLWWPRAAEAAKPLLTVRWRRGGRVRWRDVHALVGVVLAVILIGYVLSGLTWSRYWGENWRAAASTLTPSERVDAPSTPATLGDYDRLGRRIPWAATEDPVYSSDPDVPRRLSFEDVNRIAMGEHMVPGYAIIPPTDDDDAYGSYAVVNPWPQRMSEQRTLYLNQFTGTTIADATAGRDGALSRATSFGIAMHMGTQYGVLTRVIATTACLGVLLSVATGLLMWWKRRPRGGTGVPVPTGGPEIPRPAKVLLTALGVIYPAFGVSVLVALAVETVIARRRPAAAAQAESE